jgi:hypothetical protein
LDKVILEIIKPHYFVLPPLYCRTEKRRGVGGGKGDELDKEKDVDDKEEYFPEYLL